jgi:ankyrin repeat protein
MKKNINLLLLATLTFSAQAMELPTKQLSLLEVLPDELKVEIFKALTSVEKETKDKALAQAAKNIRALSVTSSTFAVLAKDKKLTGELIKELADRYTDGDLVKAAIALGTDAASEWITSQENLSVQGAISEKLMQASKDGNIAVAKFLLKYLPKDRVDVMVNGQTSLMVASAWGQIKIIDLLLAAGADVNAQGFFGTPLTLALRISTYPGSPEYEENAVNAVVERLLKVPSINLNEKNDNGDTALQLVIGVYGDAAYSLAKQLIASGAEVNTKNLSGETPLMDAVSGDSILIIDLLFFAGADPNIQSNNGNTALMIAARSGAKDMVQALLNAKADLNKKNNDGLTALYIAWTHDNFDVVEQLLRAGADPNIEDNLGYSFLERVDLPATTSRDELIAWVKAQAKRHQIEVGEYEYPAEEDEE